MMSLLFSNHLPLILLTISTHLKKVTTIWIIEAPFSSPKIIVDPAHRMSLLRSILPRCPSARWVLPSFHDWKLIFLSCSMVHLHDLFPWLSFPFLTVAWFGTSRPFPPSTLCLSNCVHPNLLHLISEWVDFPISRPKGLFSKLLSYIISWLPGFPGVSSYKISNVPTQR